MQSLTKMMHMCKSCQTPSYASAAILRYEPACMSFQPPIQISRLRCMHSFVLTATHLKFTYFFATGQVVQVPTMRCATCLHTTWKQDVGFKFVRGMASKLKHGCQSQSVNHSCKRKQTVSANALQRMKEADCQHTCMTLWCPAEQRKQTCLAGRFHDTAISAGATCVLTK